MSNEQLMGWLREEDGLFIPNPPPCTPSSTWTPLYRSTSLKVGDRVRVKRWNGYGIIKSIGYELEPPYMADAFERERDIEKVP